MNLESWILNPESLTLNPSPEVALNHKPSTSPSSLILHTSHLILHTSSRWHSHKKGRCQSISLLFHYWYWFTLLYFSPNARSSLNLCRRWPSSTPAFMSFFCCLTQFLSPRSSGMYFDGFRLFFSINATTSSYLVTQRVSWSISHIFFLPHPSYILPHTSNIIHQTSSLIPHPSSHNTHPSYPSLCAQ